MERVTIEEARRLFGKNLLGLDELFLFSSAVGTTIENNINVPPINYTYEQLQRYSKEYILILGLSDFLSFQITIRNLREKFGIDSNTYEPCFYNQDWYMNENFIDNTLGNRWYLIKKEVVDQSRAKQPEAILEHNFYFPSAILCTYTFFAYFFQNRELLWHHDFVWCNDLDHNGDRIYVGKYNDIDGINKNGFSIHRYLGLRNCYGAIVAI